MRIPVTAVLIAMLASSTADARVVRLRIERREVILNGRWFGAAGPYEKLIGKVDFAFDPKISENDIIVDLPLAPRNSRGEVEASADFYLLKPVDPRRGNGRLFFEVGNRGGKAMLSTFQKAAGSPDPTTDAQFGDGALMRDGFTLLWMGWQWDVPDRPGVMRMQIPIATENGRPIIGLVRGNFIPNDRAATAPVADRNHASYAPLDPNSADNVMTVRDDPIGKGEVIARSRWHFVDSATVALDGGFEPGRIYDVVYRAANPRVVGLGLAGTRDIISFFKYDSSALNPSPGIRYALGWGVSQSGRFLRHFLYQGFNEDEHGRRVFDGVFDQLGGAGRGSFNHRFGQASRDALQFFNILYPVDLFPFTDGPERDPETGVTDGILNRATRSGATPKVFHLLGNSEYFNRAGSLVHTDPTGTSDADIPATTRIYMIASAPHITGPFPPASNRGGGMVGRAPLNPLNYTAAVRALFRALDRWVVEDVAPPPSAYPHVADGTLTSPDKAGWPAIPGYQLPQQPLRAFHLDFGPEWAKGIVINEPPKVGTPFVVRVPAVDADGNVRAGIRLPDIAVPLATQSGWNYRDASIGSPERLAGEIGSYIPFARTRAERQRAGDPRLSIEERYGNRDEYVGKYAAATLDLVAHGYLLADDVADLLKHAAEHYDWAVTMAQGSRPAPPTRDPHTPGYVAATELPDGSVPPIDVEGNFIIGATHTPAPELIVRDGVPHGTISTFTMSSADSKIYPGIARDSGTFGVPDPRDPATLMVTTSHRAPYTRRVTVYVPAQYVPGTVAPFIVGADGPDALLFTALDNLIAEKRVPVMIAISIGNGSGDAQGSERGLEYDTMSGRYAEFVETEVLPLVEQQYGLRLTKDPEGRATMGGSSGGSAAFIMAWYHPELYHRVLAYSITAINQQWPHSAETAHGAWGLHEQLIPENPVKPIRVWLAVGDRDLFNPNAMRDNMHDWVLASENMAKALATKGYHYQFVFARNAAHVDRAMKQQTLPEALEWLWRGYR